MSVTAVNLVAFLLARRLQEVTEEHLVEVVVIIDIGIQSLMQVFRSASEDSESLTLRPSFLHQSLSTLIVREKRIDLFNNCSIED